jgi:Fe-S oxidoreductase
VTVRLIAGLAVTAIAFAVALHRLQWLGRLVLAGAPIPPERRPNVLGALKAQLVDVLAQRKLFKVKGSGTAHAFTFWGFTVLFLTIIEAYGALFQRDFAIPFIGKSRALGLIEDVFAVAVLLAIIVFTGIRIARSPRRIGRKSRFYGSHVDQAYLVLGLIFLVVATLLLYRGAQLSNGYFPYQHDGWWPFASKAVSYITPNSMVFETTFIVAQIAVVVGFLVFLLYGKHMHIVTAPLNASVKRHPKALGALGTTPDLEKLMEDENAVLGVGQVEHFHQQQLLQTLACTECGRCQDKCPAWNTGKPLNPKLVITAIRDTLFAEANRLIGGDTEAEPKMLVPDIIDPDVLWSCTTCGACVEQCPVDIEHIDHIVDMRRYQVLIESAFPSEAGVMLRNIENKGNPWGMADKGRDEWTSELSFEVRRATPGTKLDADIDYLFWVGCAGALEDRSRKVTIAFCELLHTAGVEFAVLGSGETCTGDPARRLGNEFLFQMQGMQNVETLNSIERHGSMKIVATCPHCFNTLANEYPQLGGHYEVVHHTQLLGKLIDEGKLTPVEPIDKNITYHDPCYLGRHNKVYTPPREVLGAIPALKSQEMHRCKDRGFCCGAGGARFWMEEKIGKRINVERTEEALALDPDIISTACPFCIVMLSDAVTAAKAEGTAKDHVQVLDVSQILIQSVGGAPARPTAPTPEPDPVPDPEPVA